MDHIKSSFYFQAKSESWQVDYTYQGQYKSLKAIVYLNGDEYWEFLSLPNTRTENPTKTQAKEIIANAKRLYKLEFGIRDKRDKKIEDVLK